MRCEVWSLFLSTYQNIVSLYELFVPPNTALWGNMGIITDISSYIYEKNSFVSFSQLNPDNICCWPISKMDIQDFPPCTVDCSLPRRSQEVAYNRGSAEINKKWSL